MVELPSEDINYICDHCHNLIARFDDVVKIYYYWFRKPYLIEKLENVTIGEKVERSTSTGVHTIADIFCAQCGTNVGYKIEATKKGPQYKVGKFVLKSYAKWYIALGLDETTNTMTKVKGVYFSPELYG